MAKLTHEEIDRRVEAAMKPQVPGNGTNFSQAINQLRKTAGQHKQFPPPPKQLTAG